MKPMFYETKTALPTHRAGRFSCGTFRRVTKFCLLVIAAVIIVVPAGCAGGGDAETLERRLEAERVQHDRLVASLRSDLARQEAERHGVETDYEGAVLIWGGTAAALFIAILLLARERRGRRVMDRLLRMILHRGDQSRTGRREP